LPLATTLATVETLGANKDINFSGKKRKRFLFDLSNKHTNDDFFFASA
jgi:hypothetical protein